MAADLEFHVRAILEVAGSGTKKIQAFQQAAETASNRVVAASHRITAANAKAVASFGRMAAAVGAAAVAAIGVGALRAGFKFNAEMESMEAQVGTTLRLFDHLSPGVTETSTAAEKFKANLAEARDISKQLVIIADQSPGGFQEVATLFKSMLPAAKSAGVAMQDILGLTQKVTLAAGATGQAFDEAGRDAARIIQGGAGMDVKLFQIAGPLIANAIRKTDDLAGRFDSLAPGAKFTEQFNKVLTSAERFRVLTEALGKLGGDEAAYFASNWEGATSTAASAMKMMAGEMMRGPFATIKLKLAEALTSGFLGGDRFKEMIKAAEYLSSILTPITEKFLDFVIRGGNYLADNWRDVFTKVGAAFQTGLAVAKLYAASKAVQSVGAAAVSGGASAAKGVAGLRVAFPIILRFVTMLVAMAPAFLGFLPVLALLAVAAGFLAFAFVGVAAVIAGFVAYFLSEWDAIAKAFMTGTITLGPLMTAVDHLFAKLAALGKSLFGGASAVSIVDVAVQMLTRGVEILTGVISIGLRAWALVSNAFNIVTAGIKVIGTGMLAMIAVVLEAVKHAISYLPGTEAVLGGIQSGLNSIYGMANRLEASARKDVNEDMKRPWEAAQAFDDAFAQAGKGITAKIADAITASPGGGGGGALAAQGAAQSGGLKRPSETQINVHNMNVYNDLRNEDPDRIAGAFVEQIQRRVERPTQAVTLEDYGI